MQKERKREIVTICHELFKQLQIEIAANSKEGACLSLPCVCPATTQTAHSTWEAAYGDLHCLGKMQREATTRRAEAALLRLADLIYMF